MRRRLGMIEFEISLSGTGFDQNLRLIGDLIDEDSFDSSCILYGVS